MQREDGSWYGSWAVCFTYGTWFGVEGLIAAGVSPSDPSIRKACQFIKIPMEDGVKTPDRKRSTGCEHWALLTLLLAEDSNKGTLTTLISTSLPSNSYNKLFNNKRL
jgi:hypothetical protein